MSGLTPEKIREAMKLLAFTQGRIPSSLVMPTRERIDEAVYILVEAARRYADALERGIVIVPDGRGAWPTWARVATTHPGTLDFLAAEFRRWQADEGLQAGWSKPLGARKAHYWDRRKSDFSLCDSWAFGGLQPLAREPVAPACVRCLRELNGSSERGRVLNELAAFSESLGLYDEEEE